jgi:hypothetical protein
MKLQTLLLAVFVAVASVDSMAQKSSASISPRWLHKLPTATNSTFHYDKCTSEAPSLDLAREKCLNQTVSKSGLKSGPVFVTDRRANTTTSKHWVNNQLQQVTDQKIFTETTSKGSEQKLYINEVSEYWKYRHGHYLLTTLYAKSELGQTPLFDNVVLTDRYGARGFFRSLIIPGWGQLYKGSTAKGSIILGGTALLAGGIIFTESMRKDYSDKRLRTHDASLIKSYTSKCDNWRAARNITIGAAGALYIYNLVDAIVAPGAQRVVVHNYGRKGGRYAVLPTPTENNGAGLSAMISF